MKFFLSGLCVLFIAAVGCSASKRSAPEGAVPLGLIGTTWQLVDFGPDETELTAPEGQPITATFTTEGRLAGTAGCNRYFGRYEQDGTAIAIAEIGSTRMMCPDSLMEAERRFLAALDAVDRWERRGGRLVLMNAQEEPLLRFAVQPDDEGAPGAGAIVPAPEGDPPQSVWDEARRRGVRVRAVGNEPGWSLEIWPDGRLRFLYDYGQREIAADSSAVDERPAQTVYRAGAGDRTLTATIEENACTDTMSGEAFENIVTVVFGERTYRGCGRALR